jgi:hypothetical protein
VDASNSVYSSKDGVLFDKRQTTLIRYPVGKVGSYTIPDSVTNIGETAFRNCANLTNIMIPARVTSIGEMAFAACTTLNTVTIPKTVTSIGNYAFCKCTKLTSVYFTGNAPNVHSEPFSSTTNAIIYYLPETTGWSTTFGGRPTKLWKP